MIFMTCTMIFLWSFGHLPWYYYFGPGILNIYSGISIVLEGNLDVYHGILGSHHGTTILDAYHGVTMVF